MFQVSGNVAAQLSVAEILQFDCDSHPIRNSIQDCQAAGVCVFQGALRLVPAETFNPLLQASGGNPQ